MEVSMKSLPARISPQWFSGVVMVLFLLLSCNGESPTAPPAQPPPAQPPPNATSGSIWGHVLGEGTGGVCIPDAVVEIVDGPGAGRKSIQKGPCDAWDYGDGGFEFGDLPSGITVRLRATKEGYRPQEREAVVSRPLVPQGPVQFVLSRE
jgi:hypothetical protein